MDAGIADTINRQTARLIARKLDMIDAELGFRDSNPWCNGPLADTFMGTNGATDADRTWLVFALAAKRDGIGLDYRSYPADSDWENLFASLRNEVIGRRIDRAAADGRTAKDQHTKP